MRALTLKELLKIQELENIRIQKEQDEKARIALSLKLRLCPTCGANIISEQIEKFEKPKKSFFGLVKTSYKKWDWRDVCPNDKTHYEDKGFYDTEDWGA